MNTIQRAIAEVEAERLSPEHLGARIDVQITTEALRDIRQAVTDAISSLINSPRREDLAPYSTVALLDMLASLRVRFQEARRTNPGLTWAQFLRDQQALASMQHNDPQLAERLQAIVRAVDSDVAMAPRRKAARMTM